MWKTAIFIYQESQEDGQIYFSLNFHEFYDIKIMIIKNKNSTTHSTFWSQLEADIQKYSSRAKKNIKIYENLSFQHHINKKKKNLNKRDSFQLSPNMSFTSINTIRSKTKQERQKEKEMKNKLNYLNVQKERKLRSTESARQKYEKVKHIRAQSFQEKKYVQREIKYFKQLDYKEQRMKASKVKSEKWKISQSIKDIKTKMSESAHAIRAQSARAQQYILQEKKIDLSEKKVKVRNVQSSEDRIRKKLQENSKKKVEDGKKNYQKRMWDEYKIYQLQNRKNQNLLVNFKKSAKEIQDQKEKAERDLLIYQSYLRLNLNKKQAQKLPAPPKLDLSKKVSAQEQETSKNYPFYITQNS